MTSSLLSSCCHRIASSSRLLLHSPIRRDVGPSVCLSVVCQSDSPALPRLALFPLCPPLVSAMLQRVLCLPAHGVSSVRLTSHVIVLRARRTTSL
jgi:hypothetical protein